MASMCHWNIEKYFITFPSDIAICSAGKSFALLSFRLCFWFGECPCWPLIKSKHVCLQTQGKHTHPPMAVHFICHKVNVLQT